jgi:hypothetical protein
VYQNWQNKKTHTRTWHTTLSSLAVVSSKVISAQQLPLHQPIVIHHWTLRYHQNPMWSVEMAAHALRHAISFRCMATHVALKSVAPPAPPPNNIMVEKLADFIRNHPRITIISGAGISTPSGIPDYRSPGRAPYQPIQHHEFCTRPALRQRYVSGLHDSLSCCHLRMAWPVTRPFFFCLFLLSRPLFRYWARSMFGYPTFSRALPNACHEQLAHWETHSPAAPSSGFASSVPFVSPALAIGPRAHILPHHAPFAAHFMPQSPLDCFYSSDASHLMPLSTLSTTPSPIPSGPSAAARASQWRHPKGRINAIITQNVDSLHARAGTSTHVLIELHGSLRSVRCLDRTCNHTLTRDDMQHYLTARNSDWLRRHHAARAAPVAPTSSVGSRPDGDTDIMCVCPASFAVCFRAFRAFSSVFHFVVVPADGGRSRLTSPALCILDISMDALTGSPPTIFWCRLVPAAAAFSNPLWCSLVEVCQSPSWRQVCHLHEECCDD